MSISTIKLFAIFILSTASVLLLMDDDESRYAKLNCQYRLLKTIHADNLDIDFAFLGSSRSLEYNHAPFLEQSINRERGVDNTVVLDFSRSWRASGMTYIMIKDILKHAKVKNLVIEFNKTSVVYHGHWTHVASYGDLFRDFLSRKDLNFFQRADVLFKHLSEKMSHKFVSFIKGNKKIALNKGRQVTNRDCSSKYGLERPGLRETKRLKALNWSQKEYKWDMDDLSESRNDYYIKKISELAKQNNVNLLFAYYNVSYSSPLSKDFAKEFESKYGHPLLYIDDVEKLREMYKKGYRDVTHVKRSGQKIYADWWAKNIRRFGVSF